MSRSKTDSNKQLCVLIIDDDEAVRLSLKFHFDDCGFITQSVQTAEEALNLMENTKVDAAIVDLRLPGINGIEFIRLAADKWPDVMYVIYTGSPAANIPDEILSTISVSPKMFFKPLSDLSELSDEVIRIIGNPES